MNRQTTDREFNHMKAISACFLGNQTSLSGAIRSVELDYLLENIDPKIEFLNQAAYWP